MPQSREGPKCEAGGTDRYRLILQNVRDFAIFSADLNGKINEWNPGAERFFGYTAKEVLGQPMELLYVPEDRAAGRAELEKAQAAQTGVSEDERWHLRKDGTRFFVSGVVNAMYDDAGKLCGFIKIARDITPRKRLQEELAASEAHHRLILEAIKDFAIITLDLGGTIQSWNPGATLTYGYQEAEIVGKNHSILFKKDDDARGEPQARLQRALREGVNHGEGWQRRKDGSEVYLIEVLRPMLDEAGHARAVLKVARDITLRHMTRLELERTQRELQTIRAELEDTVAHRTKSLEQTVQSLEQVLYHVAHDLRAPLRTMEGFSSILVEKYGQACDSEAERLSDLISDAARRMDRLIQDLLTYGRLCHEPVSKQHIELNRAVESEIAALGIERNGIADIEVKPDMPKVLGDPNVIRQVLSQLIRNALMYVAPGRAPQVKIWAEPKGPHVRLWIQDNGVGIPSEYLDRIFWLFERLSQTRESSTGIGLPIARKGRTDGRPNRSRIHSRKGEPLLG